MLKFEELDMSEEEIESSLIGLTREELTKLNERGLCLEWKNCICTDEQDDENVINAIDLNLGNFIPVVNKSDDMIEACVNLHNDLIIYTNIAECDDALLVKVIQEDMDILSIIRHRLSDRQKYILCDEVPYSVLLFDDATEDMWKIAIREYPTMVLANPNPTEEMWAIAVRNHGNLIRLCKNKTPKILSEYMKGLNYNIDTRDFTEEELLEAVSKDGLALRNIPNPSYEVRKAAVSNNFNALAFISNPSQELIDIGFKQSGEVLQYVENPSQEFICRCVLKSPMSALFVNVDNTEAWTYAVVERIAMIILHPNPTPELIYLAICGSFYILPAIINHGVKVPSYLTDELWKRNIMWTSIKPNVSIDDWFEAIYYKPISLQLFNKLMYILPSDIREEFLSKLK